jgi:AraC-like DNA-binding protein
MPPDWVRYWRAEVAPVEAMLAHFSTHVYHRHSHESYSFGVTEAGAQAFYCRHGRHVSGPGMVMAFNPDDPHDGHADNEDGFTYRMLHIWPQYFAELAADVTGRAGGSRAALPLFRVPVTSDLQAAASLRRLHRALTGTATGLDRYERLADAARDVLRLASAPPSAAPPSAARASGMPRVAARVRELIHDGAADGPGGELAMADLAARAGCSRYMAYRAFRSVYGMAPSDYQRQLRVRTARRLLAAGIPPAAAAAEAGFADQAHLTRWFRRYYGLTPGAYRAALV